MAPLESAFVLSNFSFCYQQINTPSFQVAVAMVVVAAEVAVVAVVATEDVVVAMAARVAVAMEVAKLQPMALHQPLVAMEATARARARARIEPATNPQRIRNELDAHRLFHKVRDWTSYIPSICTYMHLQCESLAETQAVKAKCR